VIRVIREGDMGIGEIEALPRERDVDGSLQPAGG
jgi:hypothetical protein